MAEEFEGDLSDSEFWGVDLQRATFRDVNFTGVRMKSVWLVDVEIDGLIDRLVVNGVDVTEHVRAHDPWQPLRGMMRPTDAEGLRAGWAALTEAWAGTIARALTSGQVHTQVNGEWSFAQTLCHLVFAIDKWFTVPIAGGTFHPIGMPNTGSIDVGWPGLDLATEPTFPEVLAVRADRCAQFAAFLESLDGSEFDRPVEIIENGTVPLIECLYTVFEEEFEHRRYALRDLADLS
jgi:DinB superfamily